MNAVVGLSVAQRAADERLGFLGVVRRLGDEGQALGPEAVVGHAAKEFDHALAEALVQMPIGVDRGERGIDGEYGCVAVAGQTSQPGAGQQCLEAQCPVQPLTKRGAGEEQVLQHFAPESR